MVKKKQAPEYREIRRFPGQPVKQLTVYLASRNSTGVHEVHLWVTEDDRILGSDMWRFIPAGTISDFDARYDWRTAHCFRTLAEAKADYIALERKRIERATDALSKVA